MHAFSQLYTRLEHKPHAADQIAAIEAYFRFTPAADAVWALWFLTARPFRRAVKTTQLRQWAAEEAALPLWMVEECHGAVGDLCETLALLLPSVAVPAPLPLAKLIQDRLLPMVGAPEAEQRRLLRQTWSELDAPQRFLWHKLIMGNFRAGVPQALVLRALANIASVEPFAMAHRLMGEWRPMPEDLARLLSGQTAADELARPYPFCCVSALEDGVRTLGDVDDWLVEWKWAGLRAQLIRRAGEVVLWSRGEEIVTRAFPEIAEASRSVPDGTVLDGAVLAWQGGRPLPSARLQQRLNRRGVGRALPAAVPVLFMAHDLLELEGVDWREHRLDERRQRLEAIVARVADTHARIRYDGELQGELFEADDASAWSSFPLRVSALLPAVSWDDVAAIRDRARSVGAEGVMLKQRASAYGVGPQAGAWWQWDSAPLTCDAVLVAAQTGVGHRDILFSDLTFGVWQGMELVPVARATSGLSDDEIGAVDAFVRANTTGRFGPVRTVNPALVFELAFDGIVESTRHRSGLALRAPRIVRQRHDKQPTEADTVETLRELTDDI